MSIPWLISSDLDKEFLSYASAIREVPASYVPVTLCLFGQYGVEGFATTEGGAVSADFNAELYTEIRQEAIASSMVWKGIADYDRFDYYNMKDSSAAYLVSDEDNPQLHLSPDFSSENQIKVIRNAKEEKHIEILALCHGVSRLS